MKWKGAKKRIVFWIVLAVVLELIVLLWPLLCGILNTGIWFWDAAAEDRNNLIASLIFGLIFGLTIGLGIGLTVGLSVGLGLAVGPVTVLITVLIIVLLFSVAFGLGVGLDASLVIGLIFALDFGVVFCIVYGFVFGVVMVFVTLTSWMLGLLLGSVLQQLWKGVAGTIRGFFRPWELKTYPFGRATISFFVLYIAVVLIFSCWFYACYLEGLEGLPWEKPFFNTEETFGIPGWGSFIYFSFITITSLGYGDIFPTHPFSQFLVVIETMTGIGLVAGFLAMILRVAGERGKKKEDIPVLDSEKKEEIRRLLLELPAMSTQKVAKIFDCDLELVSQIRRDMIASGEIPERKISDDLVDDS